MAARSEEEALLVVRMSEFAQCPRRFSEGGAGYDLFSAHNYTIAAWGKQLCQTDIRIALPSGCYGRVAPRSSLALRHSIHVGAGVIDNDFRGPLAILLLNFGPDEFSVRRGDRIAQMILERILQPAVIETVTLPTTERNYGAFGSTGT